MTFDETPGIRAQITELVNFDSGFKSEDAFDMRVRETVTLEEPEAEKLVVEAVARLAAILYTSQRTYPIEPPGGTMATSLSKALQLLVYMSRTRALGTSAFLTESQQYVLPTLMWTMDVPACQHYDVTSSLCYVLCGVGK